MKQKEKKSNPVIYGIKRAQFDNIYSYFKLKGFLYAALKSIIPLNNLKNERKLTKSETKCRHLERRDLLPEGQSEEGLRRHYQDRTIGISKPNSDTSQSRQNKTLFGT